jgi:hypothetical protein
MPASGEVWSHPNFYVDGATGESLTKYLLVLAVRPDGDIVYRLLTSRDYNRVIAPACVQSGDRPGYYLGVPQPGGTLKRPTWLDLREVESDYDSADFKRLSQTGVLRMIHAVPLELLCPALSCAAYAQDTTKAQKGHIMQSRASLGCA